MGIKTNGMIELKNVDGFKRLLAELSGGKTFGQISVAAGLNSTYLTNVFKRKRMSLTALKAICAEIGAPEKIFLDRINSEPEAPNHKEPERKPEPVAGADLKTLIELVGVQNKMIASIGEILTNLESIMETSWK